MGRGQDEVAQFFDVVFNVPARRFRCRRMRWPSDMRTWDHRLWWLSYFSCCTPHVDVRACAKMDAKMARFSRDIRVNVLIFTLALPLQTQGKPVVGLGHFVGHSGTMACEKGAVSFHGPPVFVFFLQFLEMLLPS